MNTEDQAKWFSMAINQPKHHHKHSHKYSSTVDYREAPRMVMVAKPAPVMSRPHSRKALLLESKARSFWPCPHSSFIVRTCDVTQGPGAGFSQNWAGMWSSFSKYVFPKPKLIRETRCEHGLVTGGEARPCSPASFMWLISKSTHVCGSFITVTNLSTVMVLCKWLIGRQ